MARDERIEPRGPLDAEATVPGSKSCTARALVMAALTDGVSVLRAAADCDDTTYMMDGLRALGVEADRAGDDLRVEGGRLRVPSAPLFLGNSGTAVRFLCAACATLEGEAVLDGTARMRERPIVDLAQALRGWGVDVETTAGCPPVRVRSRGVFGGSTSVRGDASSQYLSGLLMAAAGAARDATIAIEGELVSKPYAALTLAMMAERGVAAEHDDYRVFRVAAGQHYAPGIYPVEADASAASYFLAAAAVTGGRVRVTNLSSASHQGDARFAEVLAAMGCAIAEGPGWIEARGGSLRGIDIDLNAMPDMAQTLAVTALFAEGPTRIRNVSNLRLKECDRITATATELRKLGATVEEFEDGLEIAPGTPRGAAIDTYDDHRMAMSFALAGLRTPGVTIRDAECVSKTFPDFFDRFRALR